MLFNFHTITRNPTQIPFQRTNTKHIPISYIPLVGLSQYDITLKHFDCRNIHTVLTEKDINCCTDKRFPDVIV